MESNLVVVQAEKPYLEALKWVCKATDKPPREVERLQGIWSDGSEIYATDGVRIHLADLKPENPFPVGNWRVCTIQPAFAVFEKMNFDALKIHQLIAGYDHAGIKPDVTAEKYKAQFRIDDRFLKTALDVRTTQDGMLFTLLNGPVMLNGNLWIDDKYAIVIQLQAVIMPLHYGDSSTTGPVHLIAA